MDRMSYFAFNATLRPTGDDHHSHSQDSRHVPPVLRHLLCHSLCKHGMPAASNAFGILCSFASGPNNGTLP
jgi:hypothetical protein